MGGAKRAAWKPILVGAPASISKKKEKKYVMDAL